MYSESQLLKNEIPFVHSFFVEQSVCDGLVDHFNRSRNKNPGYMIDLNGNLKIDKSIKSSTDLSQNISSGEKPISDYRGSLLSGLSGYKKRYPALDENLSHWGIVEDFNIQKYMPGEGYLAWHCERVEPKASLRILAFMTYLNDVKDGGETEWKYLGLSVKPQKGLSVLWSADWMYLHRGITSPTQEKIIATGWFSFI